MSILSEDDDTNFEADLAAHNERALGGEPAEPVTPPPAEPPAADPPAADPPADPPPAEKPEEKPEDKPADPPAADPPPAEPVSIEITTDLPIETFRQRATQIFEQFEEVPQEIQQVVQYYEHALENAGTPEAVFEDYGGVDRVKKIVKPLDALFEGEVEGGAGHEVFRPNAKPLVEMLRTDYSREFGEIAAQIMMADSTKYLNASVLQELLIDVFSCSPKQVMAIDSFLRYKTPLPAVPQKPSLPAGVEEGLAEAYLEMPERKRYELEELAKEIVQVEADMPTLDAYYKSQAETKLADLKGKLEDELTTLRRVQGGITADREGQERDARQKADDAARFSQELQVRYLTDAATMAETFAKDLAPKLDFVDPSAQGTVANSIVARFASALSFFYDGAFNFVADPTAEHYRRQLKAEGLKFDFEAGSRLLHEHLLAVRKVEVAKRTRQSPEAIAKAERDLTNAVRRIKAEVYAPLVGQVGKKLIDAAGKALAAKVEEAAGKRQFTRKQNPTFGTAGRKNSEDTLNDEIRENNARRRRELEEEGDTLGDIVFDRK